MLYYYCTYLGAIIILEENREKYLDKKPETSLSKSDVAAYVHDMKELEIKQFTLERLHSVCVEKQNKEEYLRVQKLNEAENTLEQAKISYQTAKQNLDEILKNKTFKPNEIIEEPEELQEPLFNPDYLLLLLCWPAFIIYLITLRIKKSIYKKKYPIYLEEYRKYSQYLEYKTINTRYVEAKEYLNKVSKHYEETKKQSQETQKQAKKLDTISQYLAKHISDITKKKNQLYQLNIIPPDYRTLDSMIEFDQMYRNDLIDTVREAVKIYEERVFRGELIRGVDKIYNMLGSLTASMQNIKSALYSVQNEVRRMSDDVNQIASSSEKFQDDMIAESRAARYATEALRDTTDRCEWYMNRQYWKNYN